VVGERQKDESPLQHPHQRQAVEELHLRGVGGGAFERLKVGEDVLDQERADGDDAHQRMQRFNAAPHSVRSRRKEWQRLKALESIEHYSWPVL
jgi:hypothetical protein